jgi:hypothetical protein
MMIILSNMNRNYYPAQNELCFYYIECDVSFIMVMILNMSSVDFGMACVWLYNALTNSVALVREQTIPTERPPLVGEVSANFCG